MSATDVPRLRKPWTWLSAAVACASAAFAICVTLDGLLTDVAQLQREEYEVLAAEVDRMDRMTRERAEPEIGYVVDFYEPRDGDDPVDSAVEALEVYLSDALAVIGPEAARLQRMFDIDEADAWRLAKYSDYDGYRELVRLGPALADLYYEADRGLGRVEFLADSYSREISEKMRTYGMLYVIRVALIALAVGFAITALGTWRVYGW